MQRELHPQAQELLAEAREVIRPLADPEGWADAPAPDLSERDREVLELVRRDAPGIGELIGEKVEAVIAAEGYREQIESAARLLADLWWTFERHGVVLREWRRDGKLAGLLPSSFRTRQGSRMTTTWRRCGPGPPRPRPEPLTSLLPRGLLESRLALTGRRGAEQARSAVVPHQGFR